MQSSAHRLETHIAAMRATLLTSTAATAVHGSAHAGWRERIRIASADDSNSAADDEVDIWTPLASYPAPLLNQSAHYDDIVKRTVRRAWTTAWSDYQSRPSLYRVPILGAASASGTNGAAAAADSGGAGGQSGNGSACAGAAAGSSSRASIRMPPPAAGGRARPSSGGTAAASAEHYAPLREHPHLPNSNRRPAMSYSESSRQKPAAALRSISRAR